MLGILGSAALVLFLSPSTLVQEKYDPSKGTASVKGAVKFQGDAPRRRKLDMEADPKCHAAHAEKVLDESLIVGSNGTLKNAIVSVKKGLKGWKFEAPKDPVVLDQKGCMYAPHAVGIRTGQTLLIRNSDPVIHNVHAFPKKNPVFNEGQPVGGADIKKTFQLPEMVTVKCDIHGWMSNVVGVFDHPFFAVTGDDGSFELKGLPPGEYTIEAWHEVLGSKKVEVKLGEGQAQDLSFTLEG